MVVVFVLFGLSEKKENDKDSLEDDNHKLTSNLKK